jgi:hypothetical protein
VAVFDRRLPINVRFPTLMEPEKKIRGQRSPL